MSASMVKKVKPLAGRTAELAAYAASDLSVEEQLSGGASVDSLIAAGVLYDDVHEDEDHMFTPAPTKEELAAMEAAARYGPQLSEEQQRERLQQELMESGLTLDDLHLSRVQRRDVQRSRFH